jgi:hypothetical protein
MTFLVVLLLGHGRRWTGYPSSKTEIRKSSSRRYWRYILTQVFPTLNGQKKRPQGLIRGLRTRSSDYIALRLLLSRLACLRCENRDSYIAFHLLSDGSLAYSACCIPVKRED